jgi:hypothetical protein
MVTQQLTDLTKRGALTQHLGGQSMPKLMGSESRSINTGPLKAMPYD